MQHIVIRRTSILELPQLQGIGRRTFYETFAAMNTAENMARYLEEGFSQEKLTNELEDPQVSFYFAILQHQIIGYLKLNAGTAQTEMQEDQSIEIERIYVLQLYHGMQVGQQLLNQAISIAKEKGVSYVWLGVWEENQRAIRFYAKNGFVPFDKHIFKLGNDEQIDIMMKFKVD